MSWLAHSDLPDGTRWSLGLICSCGSRPCRGGQHVGTGRPLVRLQRDGWSLMLISGVRSSHSTRKALQSCASWVEVPLAIEAAGVVKS